MTHTAGGSGRSATPLVAALGDPNRHDFGAGPAVLAHLAGRGLDVTLVSCDLDSTQSADFWRGHDPTILVEPVSAEPCHPGRVHQLVAARPGGGRLLVFAVEMGETTDGVGLSPAVAAGARRAANAIAAEIGAAEIATAETTGTYTPPVRLRTFAFGGTVRLLSTRSARRR